jgi:hypothetical protein
VVSDTRNRIMTTLDILFIMHACNNACRWVGKRSPKQAWDECPRGDWLLWIASELNIDCKLVVLATCGCARLGLGYVPTGETRPLVAIETAEKWTRGEATSEQVRVAAAVCRTLYRGCAAGYAVEAAGFAANTAVHAATFSRLSTNDVVLSLAAVDDAVAAVYATDYALNEMRQQCADVVRGVIPWKTIRAAIGRIHRGV